MFISMLECLQIAIPINNLRLLDDEAEAVQKHLQMLLDSG